jgi:signal transduction histidine kinase/ActR/RegA family two-component response regulator
LTADPLRVLLVEDEPGHAELARRAFESQKGAFDVRVAETVDAARAALHGAVPPDLVIADWLLPDGEGLDLLRSEPAAAMPPVVIMTSHGSERVAVEAIRAGAVDYVVKSETALADLPHMAERAVRHRRVEQALGDLVAGTAAKGGEALFEELVLRLARALRVKYASVAERVGPGRVRTLARSVDGRLMPAVEYELAGTPCANVLDGSVCHIRGAVAERYPRDEGLRRMGAQSYVGVVLRASTGEVLGLVNAIHDRPLDEVVRPEGVLQVFAARAAAEIERQRLEADLRRAAFEWREAFDGLPEGVVVADAQGRIQRANRTAVEYSGRPGWADLIDTPLDALGPGEPWATLATLAAALQRSALPAVREVADPLTRRTFMVSARGLSAGSAGEGGGRAVLNFQDVTETVRLKEQLRQSETMAEIGSIVAGVAHEVRNPLFSISATLDAFESRFRHVEGHERYLTVLRGEIVRLTGLMSDLLDFGRPSRPDFAECAFEEVVEAAVSACAPLARRKSVEIVWPRRPEAARVLADRARVSQVLQNLIENAVHFSPPGGRVEVTLGSASEAGEPFVECSVKDSGPGFDPADLPRLFEPFFTRRRGGTGLGLSIVKRIVYDHGGDVSAENHASGGAVVRVRLRAVAS